MDHKKKAEFVRKMGKKRLSLAKNGRVNYGGGGLLGLFGAGGGEGGTGFSTTPGTNANQINTAYNQNQTALGNQGSLMTTLTPQAATAVNNQNVLAGQYGQQAMGMGPNVAQNKLNQATGANVANQAALMAGQRGASANPALIARQAAMQGANTQQQAAGEAATLQAKQQIAAEQAQAQLAANQIAQTQGATTANTQAQQNEQSILQNANTAQNSVQGNLANTSMQGQQGVLGGLIGGLGGGIASIFGAEGGEVQKDGFKGGNEHHGPKKLDFIHKMAKMGMEHFDSGGEIDVPQVSVNTPQGSFQPIAPIAGGFSPTENHGAAALKSGVDKIFAKKEAKPVQMGTTQIPTAANITGANNPLVINNQASVFDPMAGGATDVGFQSDLNRMNAANGGEMHPAFQGPHKSVIANYLSQGGTVKAMVSPGEVYLSPDKVHAVIHEGADPLKIGERFGGKAKVKGDSIKNDIIPRDLEEGGVVIDRENVMSPEKAALFVHKSVAKHKAKRGR